MNITPPSECTVSQCPILDELGQHELIHELSPHAFYKAKYINNRTYAYTNAFAKALGLTLEGLDGLDMVAEQNIWHQDIERVHAQFDTWFTSDKTHPLKRVYRVLLPKHRHPIWVEEITAYDRGGGYPIRGLIRLLEDNEHAISKLYSLSQKLPVMLFEFELSSGGQMRLPFTNGYVEQLFGVLHSHAISDFNSVLNTVSLDDIDKLKRSITDSAVDMKPWELEFKTQVGGHEKWLKGFAIPEKPTPSLVRWHGMITDITTQKAKEKEYRQKSQIDDMTGLVNRAHFIEKFQQTLKTQRAAEKQCVLLVADIDKFKRINDTYGHPFGDIVIKGVALSLVSSFRATDVVGRIGGEEYAILLTNTNDENLLLAAERARHDIAKLVHREHDINESVTITIGATRFYHRETWEEVFSRADEALYEGKNSGRNKVVVR